MQPGHRVVVQRVAHAFRGLDDFPADLTLFVFWMGRIDLDVTYVPFRAQASPNAPPRDS
jgi:hypothetical protein